MPLLAPPAAALHGVGGRAARSRLRRGPAAARSRLRCGPAAARSRPRCGPAAAPWVPRSLLLLLLGAGILCPGVRADSPDLPALVAAYQSLAPRTDDEGYAAQERALEAISDLRSGAAQAALERLLAELGGGDRRRAVLLLKARVRHGSPADLDAAVDWVERARDPRLLELLDRIVAAAREPATLRHLRGDALRRAVPPVKAQLARALGGLGDAEATVPLLTLLREESVLVRAEAALALGALRDARAQAPLVALLSDADPRLRDVACRALGLLGLAEPLPHLVKRLGDEAPLVVEGAAQALGLLGRPEALAPLIDRLERALAEDLRLSDALARALERISGRALGTAVESWRAWWAVARERPWQRSEEGGGGGTVQGLSYYGFPVRSSKVVFVLDVSRSMGWNGRLDTAQAELLQVIEHLPKSTRFNLVTFSDRADAWERALVPATLANVRRAMAYVRRQEPVNGTDAYDALQLAFADPEVDTIFFLSDGHPSAGAVVDPDLILAEVRAWNRFRRIHVHAVALLKGEPPRAFQGLENATRAESFLRRLADENEGRFKVIR